MCNSRFFPILTAHFADTIIGYPLGAAVEELLLG